MVLWPLNAASLDTTPLRHSQSDPAVAREMTAVDRSSRWSLLAVMTGKSQSRSLSLARQLDQGKTVLGN